MNPISPIELKAHLKDLELQVAAARRSRGATLDWLGAWWRRQQPAASAGAPTSAPLRPTRAR